MEPRRRLTAPSLPALGLALIVAVGGIAAAFSVKAGNDDRSDDRARADALALAAGVELALDRAAGSVDDAARSASPYTVIAPAVASGTLQEVALVDPDLRPDDPSIGFAALLEDPALRAVAGTSRDSGRPAASRVLDAPGGVGPAVLLFAPRYELGAPIVSVNDRHAALTGYVVAELPMGTVETAAATSSGVVGDIHGTTTAVAELPPGSSRVSTLGQTWETTVERMSTTSAAPAVTVVVSLWAAAAIVAVSSAHTAAQREARRQAERRTAEIALVNDVGAVLHSSLELGDVLPAVAVRLTDEFDLVGLAVTVAAADGTLIDAFTMGARQPNPPEHVRQLPSRIEATTAVGPDPNSLILPLEQAGRAVGALWICTRDPIDAEARARILPVADLAGSAIGNARAHAQETDARRHLADLDQMRTEFLATASHELRTPATTIDGFAQLVDTRWDDLPDEQKRDLIHRIARNARSLSQLLEQLLAFTRMERRSLVVELGFHDLDEIVRRVIDLSEPLLEHHEIVLSSDGPAMAHVDPLAVERVLLNLLTNASKYSPPGTDIEVDVVRSGDRVLLRVSDHGPGIAEEERHLVFERFYRGGSQTAVRTRGAGIGLAVVKELADRLGATIEVGQTEGGGACLTVGFAATLRPVPREGANNGAT